jgi:hypothetical protein
MDANVDNILMFLAGMILGGFLYTKAESHVLARYYPDMRDEQRGLVLRKIGFVLTFAGVFCLVLAFFFLKIPVLMGIFAGFAVFGIRP